VKLSPLLVLLAILAGLCASGAVRVDCDGPLRSINAQTRWSDPPVSVSRRSRRVLEL